MDNGKGRFETIEKTDKMNFDELSQKMSALEALHPDHGGWFREGEIVEVKGSTFRVKRIKPTEIVLKLVSRNLW